jgi:DNA-binding NtrC family response regulator
LPAQAALTGSSAILHATECPDDRRFVTRNWGRSREETMAETLAFRAVRSGAPLPSLRQLVEDYERRLILAALGRTHGNQRRAAAELGCLPTTLNEKMRRLGLRACDRASVLGGAEATEPSGFELIGNA